MPEAAGRGVRAVLKALVLVPLGLFVVLLAVANRTAVTVSLDPFAGTAPSFSITLPLFVVLFAAVALGVILGGTASWLVQGRNRRAARGHRREAQRLHAESERLKNALAARAPILPPSRPVA